MDDAFLQTLERALTGLAVEPASSIDMPAVYIGRDDLVQAFTVLRDDPSLQFAFLAEVTAVDYHPAEPRWELVYHVACLGSAYASAPARRLRVKVRVPGDDARVPTITGVYPAANWLEREVYDLMGISFDGHPDLRRILMPEDWEGFPLRRDYPVQIRKDAESWQPVQLSIEEFAANVRATRDQARRQADPSSAPAASTAPGGRGPSYD
jgi:NADH-quinone oxidoreductase subunit C